MSFDHRESQAPDAVTGADAAHPAAGKRNRTSRLQPTGIALVDHGPLCEQPGQEANPGCVLDDRERLWLAHTASVNVGVAMANRRDAIQDARIEKLTATGPGWGFLEEMICANVLGLGAGLAVIGAKRVLGHAAARLAETSLDSLTLKVAKIDEGAIKGMTVSASRGLRSELKHARTKIPEGNNGKAAFLQVIRDSVGPMTRAILTEMFTVFDDQTLIAVTLGYGDDSVHGVAAQAAWLDDLLAGFDHNQLDDVGRVETRGERMGQDFADEEITRGRLAWVTINGTPRLALYAGANGGQEFQRWIDPDWAALAVNLYRDRTGKEPSVETVTPPGAPSNPWLDSFLGDR